MIRNYEKAIYNIRYELKKYIFENPIKSLIIGVSGGIDSALCCALAKPVCEELKIPLIGVSLSIETNKPDEIERAKAIGKYFCTDFTEKDLIDPYTSMAVAIRIPMAEKIRRGNIKAKVRMIYLYDLAHANSGMVLSTDNYTELMTGFWTLHGDVGDYGMIQNLWKTEVYEMAQYLTWHELKRDEQIDALKKCIEAIPTDGLGITNSDLDQLLPDWKKRFESCREGYKEVDNILLQYFGGDINLENHPVIKRYKATIFKRNNPINIPRNTILGIPEKC